MLTLKDYVNWGITHSDKTGSAEGVPLVMESCVNNKKMKQFEVYGNSVQDGTPTPENPIEVESVGEFDADVGKYKVPVVVKGKNIFNPTVVSASSIRTTGSPVTKNSYGTTIDSIDFTDNKVVVTQVANESYSDAAYQNGYIFFEIPELVIGKTYVVSFDLNILDNPLNVTNMVMYALNTPIGTVSVTSTRCKKTFVYKEPSSGRKPDVELRCGGMSFELSNVMITEEGQDETFEPYTEPITTNVYLNEPLRKIGDYADVLDFKGKKVVRNTYKRVYDGVYDKNNPFNIYDGDTSFELSYEYDNFRQYTLSDPLPVIPKYGHNDFNHKPLCVQFPTYAINYNSAAAQNVTEEQIWFTGSGRNVRLFLSKSREELGDGSTSAFRAYLKTNPIAVYCAIYEPYEESIECDLPTLTAQTSIVEIGTTVAPSSIKGKYIKR